MQKDTHDKIWSETIGTCYDTEQTPSFYNGLKDETSAVYRDAAALSDDQIWALVGEGKL